MWLLTSFSVATLLALTWAAIFTLGLINTQGTNYPLDNFVFNAVVWLAAVAMLALQATALAGLYMRWHWGRAVATIASAFWVFTVIGIPFAILVWWFLHRRWDPGVDSTFTKEHPSAPAYLVGLCGAGTALILAWLWFLYGHLVSLLTQVSGSADGWASIVTFALFLSLPLWIVQALAVAGLVQKHDWGVVLAVITCVLWTLSLVGLPFGIAGFFVLWPWQHPALRTTASRT